MIRKFAIGDCLTFPVEYYLFDPSRDAYDRQYDYLGPKKPFVVLDRAVIGTRSGYKILLHNSKIGYVLKEPITEFIVSHTPIHNPLKEFLMK